MGHSQRAFNHLDRRVTAWMARNGVRILRVTLGLIFVWFGVLKFVPGLSPADALATRTMELLSFGTLSPGASRPLLATLEVVIGLGLLSGVGLRVTLLLLALQLVGAMSPLVLLPRETWKHPPFVLTIEGQYIAKDVILIAAGIVIGATVRGGRLVAAPVTPTADRSTSEERA